ncbi:hypothetical protein GCM10009611_07500 [Arthrobacter roseus]
MAVADLFDSVRGEDPDGVHGVLINFGPLQFLLIQLWHGNRAPLCQTACGETANGAFQPITGAAVRQ